MPEENNQKIMLYIFAGVGLTLVLYLFFKDQFKNQYQPLQTQSLHQIQSPQPIQPLPPVDYPKINELEVQTHNLEKQASELKEELSLYKNKLMNQEQLEIETNSLKEQLRSTQEQLANLSQYQQYQLKQNNKQQQPRIPIHKMDNKQENKQRQMMFGMN